MNRAVFEPGDTAQFTLTTSVAPDTDTVFCLIRDVADTVVTSITGVASTTTSFYALYTVPTTEGAMLAEWVAKKTFSGSAYNFIKRLPFNVAKMRAL